MAKLEENEKKFENCLSLKLENNNKIKIGILKEFEKIKYSINKLLAQESNYIKSIIVDKKINSKNESRLIEIKKEISSLMNENFILSRKYNHHQIDKDEKKQKENKKISCNLIIFMIINTEDQKDIQLRMMVQN